MMSQKEREFWDESEAEVIKEAEDMGVTFEHVDKAPFQAIPGSFHRGDHC